MKKISLFLTAFLTATMASAWNGSGTANAPYLIESIDDMTTLVNAIGNGNNFDNISFKLMADLDYSAIPVNSDGINFKTVGGN